MYISKLGQGNYLQLNRHPGHAALSRIVQFVVHTLSTIARNYIVNAMRLHISPLTTSHMLDREERECVKMCAADCTHETLAREGVTETHWHKGSCGAGERMEGSCPVKFIMSTVCALGRGVHRPSSARGAKRRV